MPDLDVSPVVALDNSGGLTAVRGLHETNTRRSVNLLIQRKGERFRLEVQPSPGLEASFPDDVRESDIPLTSGQLWGVVQRCREAWRTYAIDGPPATPLIFQRYWDFSRNPAPLDACLGPLALAGRDLFDAIFFPDESLDEQAKEYRALTKTGEAIETLTESREGLWIRVTSDEFYAPWNLIYSARLTDKRDGRDAKPAGFWGYSHLVEHVPERGRRGTDLRIDGPVRVTLYLDADLDRTLNVVCNAAVETELGAYAKPSLTLARRTTSTELMASLDPPLDQHVLYFCCHASLDGDQTQIKVDDAYFSLTDREYRIAPPILKRWLGRNLFTHGPVVFLNACQTAQMNSLFYQGFVPTFMSRRASALIGTQTEVAAVFAGEFARRYFVRFLAGGPDNIAGRILLDLRKEFVDAYKNPLGLLYSVYRGADVYLSAPVPRGIVGENRSR